MSFFLTVLKKEGLSANASIVKAMDNPTRYNRGSQPHLAVKQRRSGYEPSDTESEWVESPWHDVKNDNHQMDGALVAEQVKTPPALARNISPSSHNQRYPLKPDYDLSSPVKASKTSPIPRRLSKSPYKARTDDHDAIYRSKKNDHDAILPNMGSHVRRNSSPFGVSERRRHISPYEATRKEAEVERNELKGLNRKRNQSVPNRFLDLEKNEASSQQSTHRVSERSNHNYRSKSAPKLKDREKEEQILSASKARRGDRIPSSPLAGSMIQKQKESGWEKEELILSPSKERRGDRTPSPLAGSMIRKQKESGSGGAPPVGEINEIIANAKLSRGPSSDALNMESTDSIPPGDIFFSREVQALQKNVIPRNNGFQSSFAPKPKVVSEKKNVVQQRGRGINSFDQNTQAVAVSSGTSLSQTNMRSTSANSRQSSKFSCSSSKMSDGNMSFRKFTQNRQRNQKDVCFSCVRKGACKKSTSPETRRIDEASFIGKAFVVENLKQFWADKHRPTSLSGFICHKSQAQYLRQLVRLLN